MRYLVPQAAWSAVLDAHAREGWPYKRNEIEKQLVQQGIILWDDDSNSGEGRRTVRVQLGGKSQRVFQIPRKHFEAVLPRAGSTTPELPLPFLAEDDGVVVDEHDFMLN